VSFLVLCPHCGDRPYTEFWWGGELPQPLPGQASTGDEEFARVWLRRNAAGTQVEQWYHADGCKRWFVASRNTVDNRFDGID
jgi:sarcosine oxidase subunit delta